MVLCVPLCLFDENHCCIADSHDTCVMEVEAQVQRFLCANTRYVSKLFLTEGGVFSSQLAAFVWCRAFRGAKWGEAQNT